MQMRYALPLLVVLACADAPATPVAWTRVARDPNYEIFLDTASLQRRWDGAFESRFRTEHAAERLRDGKPFNREIVLSIVRCDSLWFKVRSVDMSLDDAEPISRQRDSEDDLLRQSWRRVARGTSEHMAAEAACYYGRRKFPGRERYYEHPVPRAATGGRQLPAGGSAP